MYSKYKDQTRLFILVLLILIVGLAIGYAVLQTNLSIVGTTGVKSATWDIHFDNVQVTNGSVTATTPAITNPTTVEYSVQLNEPGDYFDFTVDVVNAGSIDGMISSISSKLNNVEITDLPNYLDYSVTYDNGREIEEHHALNAGSSATYKVHVEYKRNITTSDLPSTDQSLPFSFQVTFVQADDTATSRYYTVVSGTGNDLGDEIAVGSEHFYVIFNTENEKVVIAKYNLFVGADYRDGYFSRAADPNDSRYLLQHSSAVGLDSTFSDSYKTVPFSNTNYWNNKVGTGLQYPGNYCETAYSTFSGCASILDFSYNAAPIIEQGQSVLEITYPENYSIAYYLLEYKNKIGLGDDVEIRLLRMEEAISLGCKTWNNTTNRCQSIPSWLKNTSYWLDNPADYVYASIIKPPNALSGINYNHDYGAGVRPVLVFPN